MNEKRGLIFGLILVAALVAFETFNYATTEYALGNLVGDDSRLWAIILAIAFCGIDFAGLARLFTPELGVPRHSLETWYLIGAWFLGATMNALLTWHAISLGMASRGWEISLVPVIVAALVWLIRILIIGTFIVSGDRLIEQIAWETGRPVVVEAEASYYQLD